MATDESKNKSRKRRRVSASTAQLEEIERLRKQILRIDRLRDDMLLIETSTERAKYQRELRQSPDSRDARNYEMRNISFVVHCRNDRWSLRDMYDVMIYCENDPVLHGVEVLKEPDGLFYWRNAHAYGAIKITCEGCDDMPQLDFDSTQWRTEMPKHPQFDKNLLTPIRGHGYSQLLAVDFQDPVPTREFILRLAIIFQTLGHTFPSELPYERGHFLEIVCTDIRKFFYNDVKLSKDIQSTILELAGLDLFDC